MTCKDCNIAKSNQAHVLFCPTCLYCGARLIQRLATLPIPASECSARRKAVLTDWVAMGHSEQLLRELAKGPLAIGPDAPKVSDLPSMKKLRSRKRK